MVFENRAKIEGGFALLYGFCLGIIKLGCLAGRSGAAGASAGEASAWVSDLPVSWGGISHVQVVRCPCARVLAPSPLEGEGGG